MRTRLITATAAALATLGVATVLVVPGTEAAATKTVRVDDYSFSPKVLTVKRNTTVKWLWVGKAKHDMEVVRGPKRFHSSIMKSGSYAKKFTKAGTYKIDCSIHSSVMTMVVRVR